MMKYFSGKIIYLSVYTVITTFFIILGGLSYSSALQLINALKMVSHTQEVMKDLNQLESLIEENKNLILSDLTGEKDIDIETYKLNQNSVIQQIRKVQKLTDDNIVQQRRIAEMEAVVTNIFDEIQRQRTLNRQKATELSKNIKANKIPKLQSIDNQINKMNDDESRLLIERSNQAEKQIVNTVILILFSSISGLGFILFTGLILYRHLQKQEKDRLTIIQQKELLETIFAKIPIMIVLADKNGKINLANQEWEKLFSSENIKDIEAETKYYKQIYSKINSQENDTWIDFEFPVKDGQIIDTSWAKVDLSDGEILAIGQDISRQKQSEKLQKVLFDTTQAIIATPCLDKALEIAISYICQAIQGNFAEAWIVKENSQHLELCPHFYSSKPELNSFFQNSENVQFSFDEGLPGRAWASKAIEWLSPLSQQSPSVFLRCEMAGLVGLETALGIPVLLENQVIAIFVFYWTATRSLDRQTVEIASYLIDQLALILQRKLMQKQMQELNQDLEERVKERTSELLASQEELAGAKAKADRANQAKSLFLANMSHELRTPLNGILGYAEILQNSAALPEKEKNQVNTIYNCGSHLLTLLNDVLDLSKIEAGKMELQLHEFNFPLLLQNVVEMFRVRAETKNIDFIYVADKNIPTAVCGDEKRLRQVLINLLSNAVKFTKEGTVTFGITAISQALENSKADTDCCQLKKTIRFEVCDTGVGMTPEQQESIFQAFIQVGDSKQQEEGTGLGLAITQQIVKLMDSQIYVESEAGVGSVFWFEVNLPVVEKLPIVNQVSDRSDKIIGIKGSTPKVLVVDDAPDNISLMVHLLQPIGFQVATAVNGKDGLEKFESFQPDLVITDLAMPIMDGYDLITKIRHLYPSRKVKIFAASASVFDEYRQRSIETGADDFIPKPINSQNLFNKLKQHLNLEWVYRQEKLLNNQQEEKQQEKQTEELELVPPPEKDLDILLDLASKGSIKNIIKHAKYLQKTNTRFLPFTEKVIQLAHDFQDAKIIELISSHKSSIGKIHTL